MGFFVSRDWPTGFECYLGLFSRFLETNQWTFANELRNEIKKMANV